MLNIVVPMAGHGSRFVEAGYRDPKPLIPVMGKPMIQQVIENLRPSSVPYRFIFICQTKHLKHYPLRALLETLEPECEIIDVSEVTQGAACTVLLARNYINNYNPLMIANCDQYIDTNIDDYLAALETGAADGLIMTMKAHDKKWSFIELDANNRITRVVEKEVVSDEATVGIYNYRHGADYVLAAEQMIAKDLRVNNEFYVAPTYNEMIAAGKTIAYYNIGSHGAGMYGIGTPEDLDAFIAIKAPTIPRPLFLPNALEANASPRICVISSGLDRVYDNCSDIFKAQIALSKIPIDFYGLFWQPVDNGKMQKHLQGFHKTVLWTAAQREFGDLSSLVKHHETNAHNFFSMAWGKWLLGHHMTEQKIWDQYDVFVYCRPDVCFDAAIDLPSIFRQLQFQDIFIPLNGNDYWEGGVNDQVCFGGRGLSVYLNMFEHIVDYLKEGVVLHPETLLKHHLMKNDVRVAVYPVQSFLFVNETRFHRG